MQVAGMKQCGVTQSADTTHALEVSRPAALCGIVLPHNFAEHPNLEDHVFSRDNALLHAGRIFLLSAHVLSRQRFAATPNNASAVCTNRCSAD